MNLAGRSLLHYRVVEKIGEGGMGEVWKAVDTTLDRELAIKFLPEGYTGDAERLARFVREAKMLAALNHPNIAAIFGLHEAEGRRFIAMELVPGEDLDQRIARGPLAVEEAVEIGRQVAGALEAAHENGVVHRDLKPANIKLTPEGRAKVLDLGLAKALGAEMSGDPARVSLSPTVTSAGTLAGTLLGTAAYMSPEQAKGRPVDRRADIWAFGVVLYEMLTGKRLFDAESVSETLAAVLRDEVELEALPAETPPAVANLVRRCLDRDPRTRLRDIGEARIALSPATSSGSAPALAPAAPTAPAVEPAGRLRLLPWLLVALLGVVTAVALWRASTQRSRADELLTLVAPIPQELRLPNDQMGVMALSPDGKTLALALQADTTKSLYVRRLDSPELVQIPGTENAATPFFSPDGRWIGFFADDKLKKVPVTGGAAVTLCEANGSNRGADWGPDDFIVYEPHYTRPLMRVSGAGGEPTPLTTIRTAEGERTHRWPQSLADHDVVLFTVGTLDSPESYDDARIDALRLSTGERRAVLERASMARYLPSGHLVFGREGFLFAVPFDIDDLEVRGRPVPVLENVMGMRSSGVVHVGFARDGLMAYIAGIARFRQTRLVWRDRDGRTEPLATPVAGYVSPRLSPDRKQIAGQVAGATSFDIWTFDIERGAITRLTFEGTNTRPVWSPDGKRIAFASVRDNALTSIYTTRADGSGQAELLYAPDGSQNAGQATPNDWTPDGQTLVLDFTNENSSNIGAYSEKEGTFRVLLETPGEENTAAVSPNGRWLAYMADESGEFQIFVRDFPGSGGKWQVSIEGGYCPRWSPDGTELFYRSRTYLYSVSVDPDAASFKADRPRVVFDDLRELLDSYDYDVFDTRRFLYVESVGDETTPPGVTVVVNWLADLERRVPR